MPRDEDLDALIEQARSVARARALEILTEELTESLVSAARARIQSRTAEPAGAPPAVPAPEPRVSPAPEPETGFGLYVYCVLGAAEAADAGSRPGVDPRHSVELIAHDDLAAAVSRVPLADFGDEPLRERLSDMDWLERTARTHEEVLEAMAARATLVPMRLCSIYRSESGVREMLEREAAPLHDALAHLAGREEWGVKVFADPGHDRAEDPRPAAEGEARGSAYFEQRLAERRRRDDIGQLVADACQDVHERLAQIAAEARTSPPQRPEVSGRDGVMVLNGAYLVADADADAFHAEVARLQDEHGHLGLELVPTGPWPAYNFVPGAIGAAW